MGSIIMPKRTPEEIILSVKRYQRGETSQGVMLKMKETVSNPGIQYSIP